jgi:hypothetical protein
MDSCLCSIPACSEEVSMLKHHLIRRALTGGVVIAAVALPTSAWAGTWPGPPVCQGVCQLKGHMYVDPD